MNPANNLEPFVGLTDVADFLGLSIKTLRKWREHGAMPFQCYNLGRRLAFRLSEVSAWAEKQAFSSAAAARARQW